MKNQTKVYCLAFILIITIPNMGLLVESEGVEIQVNTTWENSQRFPSIASDPNGNFVITWASSKKQDGSGWGIFAQRFVKNGTHVEEEFQVNTETMNDQTNPCFSFMQQNKGSII